MDARQPGPATSPASGEPFGSSVVNAALLLLAWLVTRAILMSGTFLGDVPGDVAAYQRWAGDLASGASPAADLAYVYPPGALGVISGVFWIAPENYYRAFTLLASSADLAILVALWWRVRSRTGQPSVAPWAWVVMGFAAGPLIYQRYDIFAALLAVAALLSLSRPLVSGTWAGLGLLVKLWPEIVLLGLKGKALGKALVANALVVALGWGVLHVVWGDSWGFIPNVLNKGLAIESTTAFPFLLARGLGSSHAVTDQFGSYEVVGPGVELAATLTTLIGVLVLLALFGLRLAGRLANAVPGDLVLLAVLIFVATHKINSVQYGVWIAAMTAGALTFSGSRVRGPAVLLTLMLLLAAGAIWPNFIPLTGGNTIFLGYQGVRLALLLVAVAWLAKAVFWDQRRFNSRPSEQPLTQ